MNVRNVLVFPAGTEIGLEVHQALCQCKEVRLFGAGTNAPNHGPFAFERHFPLPLIHEPNWLEELVSLCRRLSIDYIFPAYDDVIVALAVAQQHIPAVILTVPLETCLLTRSKRATYAALGNVMRVPRVFDMKPAEDQYPLIVKPDRGQGSQGVALVHTPEELAAAAGTLAEPLVCEFLPGEEYTVDCFSDRERGVLFAGARARRRTRNGISVNTIPVKIGGIEEIARRIHAALHLRGAWFFQVKRAADGELALLEVAPRIAGSMSLHRVTGVNFPLLTIFEHERIHLEVLLNNGEVELDRALRNRYRHSITFSVLYIDFDDTLIFRDLVNPEAVRLIFQCRNRGCKVKLLTRHAGDLAQALHDFGLASMFDEVIHVRDGRHKSDFIREPDAILVDDSFSERREVRQRRGIRTFDGSMIEVLTEQAPALEG